MLVFIRRISPSIRVANTRMLSHFSRCFSNALPSVGKSDDPTDAVDPFDHHGGRYSSPLFWEDQPQLDSRRIEVVDSDTWRVSSLARGVDHESEFSFFGLEDDNAQHVEDDNAQHVEDDNDFDEIEDMRIHGKLFYKIDRSSKEFEEYAFDFHRRKSSSNNMMENTSKENNPLPKVQNPLKVNEERLVRTIKENYVVCTKEIDNAGVKKRQRALTFNQLTGPYHEPYCLDIFVSKGSIRACVVHRVTSKVVVVAHSISKDMKFDLGSSTKSTTAAAAVGKALAQRALEDDIHDVVYTPRKGDKLEGKLQIVLQTIMESGVNVKVKITQRNPNKPMKRLFG